MQREEKMLEASTEAMSQRVLEVRNSIAQLIMKLEREYETLNWPKVLDSFALLSGQINMLGRVMKSDKCPPFRNQVLLPLSLVPDRDTELEKLTEGRLQCFNHEVVPDYLRTKPEPEAEEKINNLHTRVNNTTADLQKQINLMNKCANNVVDQIQNKKEEWESEMNQKQQQPQTSSQSDTITLLSAITNGSSLRRRMDLPPQPPPDARQMQHAAPPGYHQSVHHGNHHYGNQYAANHPHAQQHQVKAPSTIKTNIRAGGHPYSRP